MEEFTNAELKLRKDVKVGDKESMFSLFSAKERYVRMEALMEADEDTPVKVIVGELGEVDLKLGNDIEKGRHKCVMTLFAYDDRTKEFRIKKGAKAGDSVAIRILVTP